MKDGRVKSLIEELDLFVPQRDKHQIVEARATNVIASAVNLMNLIAESFTEDEADELQRRLLGAIKNRDPDKFNRKIREYRKIEESKRGK
jgi:sigma54-dependent transcription regulator